MKSFKIMKKLTFIFLLLITSLSFGQKSDIEDLINQIAENEVPENFEYYFLVPRSFEQEKINDSLQNYQVRELKMVDKDFPEKFIYTQQKKDTIDWRNYDLEKVNYVSNEYNYNHTLSPPQTKKIKFVKYNIDNNKYDSIVDNKEPYTLIVKKKWLWNKKRIWNDKKLYDNFVQNWTIDDKNNPEETVYFHFSKPIFSENKKYALVSIFKKRRCDGIGFTSLYRNENGTWKKIMEFNQVGSKSISTHIKCEDIKMVNYN
jgi:hypothetical protein